MVVFLRFLIVPIIWLGTLAFGWVADPALWQGLVDWFTGRPSVCSHHILNVYLGWRLGKWGLRYWYALRQSKHLVKLKVMLPRGDSKIDQEKRTEKDFKEKIAIMEQLYRALWEVKSLNVWQIIHFWFWRYLTISFEMYLDKGLITFYVVTQPKLASIVEKQITSFYPDAEIIPEETPEIWPKGSQLVAYNMQLAKGFMYPLRFYEQMQDDPLNGICNVLSKLEDEDSACIQMVLTPSFSGKWGGRAKQFASTRFKGKKSGWFDGLPFLNFLSAALNFATFGGGNVSNAPGASGGDSFVRMIQPEEELYKRMGEKAV